MTGRGPQPAESSRAGVVEWDEMTFSDHKTLARFHFWTALFFMLVGGGLALLMRWQLAWPGTPVPVAGQVLPALREQGGVMAPEVYAVYFSQHGTVMIFFVIIPLLVGAFGNFLIPLQVGARNLLFPRLAAAGYVVHLVAGLLLLASFWVPGGASATGWTAYAPLSVTGGAGQTLWIISLIGFGAGQILTAISQAVTIVSARAPGMTWMRLPIACWGFLATAALTLLSTPALAVALLLLLLDRTAGTSFFVPSGTVISGTPLNADASAVTPGQPLLWQHLFWFYAHPAVYILILPAMGVISEIIPVFARKPLFGYKGFVVSMGAIAGLGFVVWGHHMFVSGMNPMLGAFFSAATFLIAIPSAVETFNWLATLWGGSIRLRTPMLFALAFLATFIIGGFSGVFQASGPVNLHLHDTYFVVAHIHYVVFGGSVFALFAAVTYYFPKIFGRMLDERLGQLHFWLSFLAFNATFFPMHLLGIGGMPRRLYDPTVYESLRPLQPLNVAITWGSYALAAAQVIFIVNVTLAFARRRRGSAPDNPWRANTLEWQTASPPPPGNFPDPVRVHRPPYEYSAPLAAADYWPQNAA